MTPANGVPGADLRIGEWRVDAAGDQLIGPATTVKLEPRIMRLLQVLARRPGEVIPVAELLHEVWHDVVVTPESVYQAVAALRRALGDDGRTPKYIVSVPRKGYRLVARVVVTNDGPHHEERPPGAPRHRSLSPWWPAAAAGVVVIALLVASSVDRAAVSTGTPDAAPYESAATGPAIAGAPHRVLWVDDRPDNNRRERDALGVFGVEFSLALSTEEALERLQTERFDLIISDLRRPGDEQAGYTLLERLQAQGDATRFVVYTGGCTEEQRLEARRRGAIACTSKLSELMQSVMATLEAKR
jgi:DNA-binding winged helix-turn-helix (wHTH) protein/CheY-like chemotaxis protein